MLAAPVAHAGWLPDPSYGRGGIVSFPTDYGGLLGFMRGPLGPVVEEAGGTNDTEFVRFTQLNAAGIPVAPPAVVVTHTFDPTVHVDGPLTFDSQHRPVFSQRSRFGQNGLFRTDAGFTARDPRVPLTRVTGGPRPSVFAVGPQGDALLVSTGRERLNDRVEGRIQRLDADGHADPTFGEGGVIDTKGEAASCVAVRADGSFVARFPTRVAGFDTVGHPDLGFGNNGSAAVARGSGEHRDLSCPVVMSDGSMALAQTRKVARGARRGGYSLATTLVRVARDGTVVTRKLGTEESIVGEAPGGDMLVAGAAYPRLEGTAGVWRISAYGPQLQPVPRWGESSIEIPRYAVLGHGTSGNLLSPYPLDDGEHALVPVRQDDRVTDYTRISLSGRAPAGVPTPLAKPRLRARVTSVRKDQTLSITYSCAAACAVARVDAEGGVIGEGMTGYTPSVMDHGSSQRLQFPFPLTGYGEKTLTYRLRVRATDGFGRSAQASFQYRLRCFLGLAVFRNGRLVRLPLTARPPAGDVSVSGCRRL